MAQNLKRIGRGNTADVLAYGEGEVLKLFHPGRAASSIEYEYHMSSSAHRLGIPTPKPLKLVEHDGRQGIVFEHAAGPSMLDLIRARPWHTVRESTRMAALHRAIHTQTAGEPTRSQRDALAEKIRRAAALTRAEREAINDYLVQLPDHDNRLCHGDLHPGNILIGDRVWIIDWMDGTYGSPAGDVARTVLLSGFGVPPGELSRSLKTVIALIRKLMRATYLRHYLRLTGMERSQVKRWLLPVAAARLTEKRSTEERRLLLKLIRHQLDSI